MDLHTVVLCVIAAISVLSLYLHKGNSKEQLAADVIDKVLPIISTKVDIAKTELKIDMRTEMHTHAAKIRDDLAVPPPPKAA